MPTSRQKNKKYKGTLTEYQEHKIIWSWVSIMQKQDKRFLNIRSDPSQGNRSWKHMQMLKSSGFTAGFPDLGVYYPSKDKKYPALFIELKAKGTGAYASPSQLEWIDRLRLGGFRAEVAYGADETIDLITEHFGL